MVERERGKKRNEHCSVHKQRTGRRRRAEKKRIYCMDQPSSTYTWNENDYRH